MSGCRNIRFIASAGTGKTHQVVSLYQSLLLGRPYPPDATALPGVAPGAIFDGRNRIAPERILMLTFTKNAAAEMRSRVTEAIERELATGGASNEAFCWSLLRRLSSATISTIHSFAQQVLAAHTLQLGLSPTLTVLEEAEAEDLRNTAILAALKSVLAGTETDDARSLEALCDGHGLNGIQDGIRQILRKSAAWGIDLEHTEPSTLVGEPVPPSPDALRRLLEDIRPAAVASSSKLLQTMAQELGAVLKRLGTHPPPRSVAAAAAELIPLTTRTWGTDEGAKALRGATQSALRELAGYPARLEGARLLTSLLRLARTSALGIREQKRAHGVLDFDDLLFKARDLIRDQPGSVPPIEVIIVDEAQDNSRLQNELIRLIQTRTNAAVVMCGDTKQTIYGWRGADPDGLSRLAEELRLEAVPLRTSYRSQKGVLDWVNGIFASVVMGPDLYGENEMLQPCPAAASSTGPAVELLLPEWEALPGADDSINTGKTTRPRLSLTRSDLRRLADGADPDGAWKAALNRMAQAEALEARAVARRIRLLTAPDTSGAWHPPRVWDARGHAWVPAPPIPYRFRDILILLRASTRQDLYEQALQEEHIPFTTDGKGRGFFSRQETLDVSNLLSWLAFPQDRLAYIGVLRSPFVALSDSAVALLERQTGPAAQTLDGSLPQDAAVFRRAAPILARLRSLAGGVSAADLIRQAIRLTGYDAILAGTFHGVQRLANLQKLLTWIQTRERSENLDLQAIAACLSAEITSGRESPDAAVLDPNDDSVRINTIHAAKGLSSPVVIIADLRRRDTHDRDWILVTRDGTGEVSGLTGRLKQFENDTDEETRLECEGFTDAVEGNKQDRERESRRLFYVACTRARDLVIFSGENPPQGGDETWRAWINQHLIQCGFSPHLVRLRPYGEVEAAWRSFCAQPTAPPPLVTPAQLMAARVVLPVAAATERYRFPVTALTHPVSRLHLAPVNVASVSSENGESPDAWGTILETEPDSLDRAQFGTVAHRVLETLDYWSGVPWSTQIRQAAEFGALSKRDRTALMPRLTGAIELLASMLRDVPPENVIRELPFAARFEHDGAEVIVDGKVDLMFLKEGTWTIIDYKFSDLNESELAEGYALQLAVYGEALSSPLPGTTGRRPRFTDTGPTAFRLAVLGVDVQGRCRIGAIPVAESGVIPACLIHNARALSRR